MTSLRDDGVHLSNPKITSGRWITGSVLGIVLLMASYLLAVWTRDGQAIENAALRGADQVPAQDLISANETLNAITVGSLAAATLLVAVIGLFRRRIDLAVAGVGIIVLGQMITQGLKRYILPRPALVEVSGDFVHNSFPSGHTTIAMTVLFSLILVVPYRWRGMAVLLVASWAVGIGAYTTTAKWHRLSDTIGAMAVALLCACLASWWLTARGRVRRYEGRSFPGRVVLVVLIAVGAAAALGLGSLIWIIGAVRGVDFAVHDEAWEYNAYLGANVIAAGAAGIVLLLFWALWRRLEIPPIETRATLGRRWRSRTSAAAHPRSTGRG